MMTPETKFARLAGIGYAVIFVLSIHSNVSVLSVTLPASDPETLFRFAREEGVAIRRATAALLVVAAADVLVLWALYRLCDGRESSVNALSALFRLVYTVAQISVILHLPAAVRLANAEIGNPVTQSALVAEEMSRYVQGFTLTLFFFGIHLILLGLLIVRTRRLPAAVGVLVGLAGLGYLSDGAGLLFFPELRSDHAAVSMLVVLVPAVVGETLLMLWLLFGPIATDRSVARTVDKSQR